MRDYADVDDCNPNPCANDGTCTDGVDTYTCECAAGYEGPDCNISKWLYTLLRAMAALRVFAGWSL